MEGCNAKREQEQKKSEWGKDSQSRKCTRIHTDPTLQKQSETVLDRGAAVAEREVNDSTEGKASVDQFQRTLTHAPLPSRS